MPAIITDIASSPKPTRPPSDLKSATPAIVIGMAAAFGGFLYGYDTGTISGIIAMPAFKQIFGQKYDINVPSNFDLAHPQPGYDLPTAHQSLIVSILSAGTFVGSLAGAPLADNLGRKIGMQIALPIFCAGVAMQTASTSVGLLAAGRAIAGLGVGIVSTIVPMYQSETAPRWIRGAVVSGYQWAITIGLLIAAIVNNSTQSYMDTRCYRIPIAIQIAFAFILSVLFFVLPESPRWYIKKGNRRAALQSLARLNASTVDDPSVTAEAELIQMNLDTELQYGNGGYRDYFSPNERKYLLRTMTGVFLQAWQQLTGINFIFYYGTKFFSIAVPSGNPYHFTIISNVVNVIMTVPGMWWMDFIGRRDILIGGALWMTVCELIVAVVGTVEPKSNAAAGKSLVAFVCLYIAAFASTWGPAAWVVCGEIFPLAIRAKALSLCVASNWLWNFGIGYATPYLVNTGPGYAGLGTKVFFIWSTTCFCSAIYAFLFIYETKGLSLEEVDAMHAHSSAVQSSELSPSWRSRSQLARLEHSISVRSSELGRLSQSSHTTAGRRGSPGLYDVRPCRALRRMVCFSSTDRQFLLSGYQLVWRTKGQHKGQTQWNLIQKPSSSFWHTLAPRAPTCNAFASSIRPVLLKAMSDKSLHSSEVQISQTDEFGHSLPTQLRLCASRWSTFSTIS